MKEALRHKFEQNLLLKEILLSTQNAYLSEHTENDSFWGDGGDDSGKNMLGKSLMELRDQLLKEIGNSSDTDQQKEATK